LLDSIIFLSCLAIILITFFISSFKFPYTSTNKFNFNAVYYSVVQVYNGTPLLVDNFINTYGLYPHFIVPLMKLFDLSVLCFSTIMAFLNCFLFLFILIFLKNTIKNNAIIFLAFSSIFYCCFLYSKIITEFDICYAIFPIRMITIASLFLFGSLYMNSRSKWLYWGALILFSMFILWNPEFGFISFASLLLFLLYLEFENKSWKRIISNIARHIVTAFAVLAAVFISYYFIIKLFYGSYPDFYKLFMAIKLFAVVGFFMLPMPLLHPWNFIILVYIVGLSYSIAPLITKKYRTRSTAVFLLSITGTGIFSYYQGRSHNWNLAPISFPAFLLLAIFADDLLTICKKNKIFVVPLSIILFVISFSIFQIVSDHRKITALMFETENKFNNIEEQHQIIKNAEFVDFHSEDREKVMIFVAAGYQGLFHSLSKTTASFNPGLMTLSLKSDYHRIISVLAQNKKTKVFYQPNRICYYFKMIPLVLSCFYDIDKTNGEIALLRKKQQNNSAFVLMKSNDSVLHENFSNDLNKKFIYALGKNGGIHLNKDFTVQIIFKKQNPPKYNFAAHEPDYANWGTLICNLKGNKGFALQQLVPTDQQYVFHFQDKGIVCPVKENEWNYLVFQVNNQGIKAFADGQLAVNILSEKEFVNSDQPLFIGNYNGDSGFFWGDIKEIKISNGSISDSELNRNQNRFEIFKDQSTAMANLILPAYRFSASHL